MSGLIRKWNEKVFLHKDQMAIYGESGGYSYNDLNSWIDQVSDRIKKMSDREVVGVMIENSIEYVVCVIASLKAGKGFVPIDIDFPADRKKHIVDECKLDLILYKEGQDIKEQRINGIGCTKLYDDEIAYILYTSGTTGSPKGIIISQDNLENLIEWFGNQYKIDKSSKIAQLARCTFDVSIEEIFGCLFNGGTLFIPPQSIKTHIEDMRNYIEKMGINMIQGVPIMIKEHFSGKEKIACLKTIISGGEALSEELKNDILGIGYELYNNYGPTETTVDALSSRCNLNEPVNLGKSILNSDYVVLDDNNNPVENGMTGELCILGKNVAVGYINAEENNNRFCLYNGERLYKTGDLVKIDKDLLIYIGRKDSQVKVFGHRIELEEIENAFCKAAGVKCCGATVLQGNRITIFYEHDHDVNSDSVMDSLKDMLPQYMLPYSFIRCKELPVTNHGKLDRSKLKSLIYENDNKKQEKSSCDELSEIESAILLFAKGALEDEAIELDLDTELMKVGMNSISFVTMIIDIEDEFDIEFDDDSTISDFISFRDISEYVSKMI
ncbi:MAG: amino acid adenylation domain-containing protein [Eubacterium sp.]|nr:amino acid adenylation domain-containing protein [Eubacterium sp.]